MKNQVYQCCLNFIEERIKTAREALAQAQEASSDDTKSSAGDKFETGREMAQQDINRNTQLLADAQQQHALLLNLKDVPEVPIIRIGSLVMTDQGAFYLGIPAGQFNIDGNVYFAISALSPIGQLLIGKSVGAKFSFNNRNYVVQQIL